MENSIQIVLGDLLKPYDFEMNNLTKDYFSSILDVPGSVWQRLGFQPLLLKVQYVGRVRESGFGSAVC